MVFMVQNLAQLRKFDTSRLWRTHTHTHVKLVQYSTEAESAIDVWNCFHFRQLRPWVLDIYCCLKIKSDAGLHSQFLQCFSIGSLPLRNSTWIGFFIWNGCNCKKLFQKGFSIWTSYCGKKPIRIEFSIWASSDRIFHLNWLFWKTYSDRIFYLN